jgi:hypothetical protein
MENFKNVVLNTHPASHAELGKSTCISNELLNDPKISLQKTASHIMDLKCSLITTNSWSKSYKMLSL